MRDEISVLVLVGTVQSHSLPSFDQYRYTNIVSGTDALPAMPSFASYTEVARRFQLVSFQVHDGMKK